MFATQQQITSAYQHGEIPFSLWASLTKMLDKLVDKWDDFAYNEVIKNFDMEVENARASKRK